MLDKEHPAWNESHETLRNSLQKEIHLMREILANMHEEELSLLLNDKGSWNQVMQNRFNLIERLSVLRQDRILATQKVESLAKSLTNTPLPLPLEKILPMDDVTSCEILSLRDQLFALIERMNKQNGRNDYLFYHVEHSSQYPGSYGQLAPIREERPKRKAAVATIQIKR